MRKAVSICSYRSYGLTEAVIPTGITFLILLVQTLQELEYSRETVRVCSAVRASSSERIGRKEGVPCTGFASQSTLSIDVFLPSACKFVQHHIGNVCSRFHSQTSTVWALYCFSDNSSTCTATKTPFQLVYSKGSNYSLQKRGPYERGKEGDPQNVRLNLRNQFSFFIDRFVRVTCKLVRQINYSDYVSA